MRHTFPSIAGRPYGYTLHTDSMALWDQAYRAGGALGGAYGEFQTYGDGQTQHSVEYAVTLVNAADYFASLAAYLLSKTFEPDEMRQIVWAWPMPANRDEIKFALSVEYKEGKRRFFNVRERKVSSSERLEHDKRWFPVRRDHIGTVDSALSVLREGRGEHMWSIETWARREQIREVARELGSESYDSTGIALLHRHWQPDEELCREADSAFRIAAEVIGSFRARFDAGSSLDCYVYNLKRRMKATEESAA